jgi:hypothetical protein
MKWGGLPLAAVAVVLAMLGSGVASATTRYHLRDRGVLTIPQRLIFA